MNGNTSENAKVTKGDYRKARRFFVFLKPYRLVFAIGWICLVLSTVASMLFPALMGQLLGANKTERAIFELGSIDLTDINTILVVMIFFFAIQAVFSFFRVLLFTDVTENALRDMRITAFERLVMLPVDFYNRNKTGEITSRIATDITLLQKTLQTTVAEFFRQIIVIFLALGMIFYISWELALWMLAVVPLLAVIAISFGRYIRKLSKKAQEASAQSNSIIDEVLTSIISVKAFTNERFETNRYSEKVAGIVRFNKKSGLMRGLFASFIIFVMFGGIAFVIWKAKQMEGVSITTAEFNAFILYTIFLGASFGSIPDLYAEIQKAIGATEHLMEMIAEPVEESPNEKLPDHFQGKVEFQQVNFSYPQRKEVQVLKDVSFVCNPGQTTALVGSSGAGKSTISSLLLKFYPLNSGSIRFDGKDISTLNNHSLRSQMAIVPQEVILFGGTIYENILYGNTSATEEQVMAAAKKANAADFILSFPDKMQTLVGDRGIQLSGGQKQRIAIARAVLKDPKILILDEATSALDAESERLVQEALDKLMVGRTSFVIAHRLSTIKKADNILVLDNGRIVEQGRHDELMQAEGTYYRLNKIQTTA